MAARAVSILRTFGFLVEAGLLGVLAWLGPHAGSAVRQGLFVDAIAGAGILMLLAVAAAFVGTPRSQTYATSPSHALMVLFVGLVGVTVGAGLWLSSEGDLASFRRDISCRPGALATTPGGGDTCRIARARIVDEGVSTGKRALTFRRWLHLALGDGSEETVYLDGGEVGGDIWDGARYRGDIAATVQYYRGEIARVGTATGSAATATTYTGRETGSIWLTAIAAVAVLAGILELRMAPDQRKRAQTLFAEYQAQRNSVEA
jgi:hypothetical protein